MCVIETRPFQCCNHVIDYVCTNLYIFMHFIVWCRVDTFDSNELLCPPFSLMMPKQMMTLTSFWTNQRVAMLIISISPSGAFLNQWQHETSQASFSTWSGRKSSRKGIRTSKLRSQSAQIYWTETEASRHIKTTLCCLTFTGRSKLRSFGP